MRSFLICPVRGNDPLLSWAGVVKHLEEHGFAIHWPPRDTNQEDTGLRICADNKAAIEAADLVHVIWDGKSQGCLFDLGMAFALNKPVEVIRLPEPTGDKSFQNMVRAWAARCD